MKHAKLTLLFCLLAAVGALAFVWSQSSPSLPKDAELLAGNTVIARYTGVQEQPCRFMTALCPDRCNHATRLANFEVLENVHYEKNSQYGDDKLAPGDTAVVDVKKEVIGQPESVVKTISGLKPGDVVRLTISHLYVKQGQGQFPARPAVQIELVPQAPAAE